MPLRALLIGSLCYGVFAAQRQPTARYVNKLSLVDGGGETGEGATHDSARGCPSKLKGVMFNHIQKTGGSVVVKMLEAIFTRPTYNVEEVVSSNTGEKVEGANLSLVLVEDGANLKVTEQDASKYFVIGLIRRPCDYMLSSWVQKCGKNGSSKYSEKDINDKDAFKQFVTESVSGEPRGLFEVDDGLSESDDDLSDGPHISPLMSVALADRYGTGDLLNCYVRLHNVEADLLTCVSNYEACGGVVDHALLSHATLASAMKDASDHSRAVGRSVGDHNACTQMFDKEMISSVLQTEQGVIDKYQLGECCSSSN